MENQKSKINGPRAELDLTSTLSILRAFSDDTIAAAIQDIIFSLDLKRKDEYTTFIQKLSTLIKEQGARTRLEQSLIAQVNLLQRRKPKAKQEDRDISKVFAEENQVLDNLSTDLKLQLDITNYILVYFKKGEFNVVEKCLDTLLEKDVLINTVKNFVKKEIDYYITSQDSNNVKRVAEKYMAYPKLAPTIKDEIQHFISKSQATGS